MEQQTNIDVIVSLFKNNYEGQLKGVQAYIKQSMLIAYERGFRESLDWVKRYNEDPETQSLSDDWVKRYNEDTEKQRPSDAKSPDETAALQPEASLSDKILAP